MATHTPTPQFKFNGSGADTHISLPARTGISKSQDHTCSQLLLYVHSHTPRCFIAGVVFGKTEWGRCALAIPSMYGQHSPISSLPVHLRVRPPRRPVAIFRFFRRVSFRTVSGIFCRSPHALPKRCGIANSGTVFSLSPIYIRRFTNQYSNHEFLFDIHPPLGKLVLYAVSLLVGYDHTKCSYEGIQHKYAADCKFLALRATAAFFGSLTGAICSIVYIVFAAGVGNTLIYNKPVFI